MPSQFYFFKQYDPFLYDWIIKAEQQYSLKELIICISILRAISEKITIKIYNNTCSENSKTQPTDFYDYLITLERNNVVSNEIIDRLHFIRIKGNEGIHDLKTTQDIVTNCLVDTFYIIKWYSINFYQCRGIESIIYELPEFQPEIEETIQEKDKKISQLKSLLETYTNQINQGVLPDDLEFSSLTEDLDYRKFQEIVDRIKETFRKISILVGETKQENLTLKNEQKIKPGLGLNDEAEQLNSQIKDLEKGIFKIIVLGEFNHGKSTFLNALLGQEILPASICPTTAIIAQIIYGDQEKIEIVRTDSTEVETITPEDFTEIYSLGIEEQTQESQETVNKFEKIKYATVYTQSPLLENSIMLIDSPGLNEHELRSKLSFSFFQDSQAVIILLDPTQPFSLKEKEFIEENCQPGYMDHVFFVFNKFDKIRPRNRERIKEYCKQQLSPYFLDTQGGLDEELYQDRVFFVSSSQALEARTEENVSEKLEHSGIEDFENKLENFLTSRYRVKSIVSSKLKFLLTLVEQVRLTAENYRSGLEQSLEELEQKRKQSERELEKLQMRKVSINEAIKSYTDLIVEAICSDLESYILSLERTWSENAKRYLDCDELNPVNLAQALVIEETKNRVQLEIKESLERYLEESFQAWNKRIPRVVENYGIRLSNRLDTEINDFVNQLAEIENVFLNGSEKHLEEITSNRDEKLMQVIAGLAIGDFSGIAGSVLGAGAWTNFIWSAVQQTLIAGTILTLFGGPIEWILVSVAEIIQIVIQGGEAHEGLLNRIGEQFHKNLREQLPTVKEEIRSQLDEKFKEFSQILNQALDNQIEEVNQEQEQIIQEKQSSDENLKIEVERIELIRQEIIAHINTIIQEVYGKEYTLEQIECMAQWNKVSKEEN